MIIRQDQELDPNTGVARMKRVTPAFLGPWPSGTLTTVFAPS